MLQIKNISKEYRTGDLVQKALDHVSLDLRDSEFVAVLGPSGSGKTTLLNIVGGLDRYDSGDLVINGISTKKYRDRDWDSYRNHTIGFVFQSYNLIMHQSVLANVELALSISGISGNERRERSMEALRRVGLAGQEHKKPSQLSGGQMQRVAIARALVNDPDIVLADEPTGALDTETSIQVMDILKEVAKDRLVVMVTHNPDLAQKYATRIVTIKDGRILSDTNPPETGREEKAPVHRNMGKAAMSFLTALALSGNNLRTKKTRTLLVSFAGSIGIIGIALILALSSGANRFIQTQEAETLAMYPLQIEKTGYDLTSMMKSMGDDPGSMFGSGGTKTYTDAVGVDETAGRLLKDVSTNDLGALKSYLDSRESGIQKYVNAIEYNYGITPQIYTLEDGTAEQLNPNHLFDSLSSDDSGNMDIAGMMTGSLSVNLFSKLPTSKELYQESYDLKSGHWPEKDTDLTLVLNSSGEVSDVILYALGLRDRKELEQRIENFADGKKDDTKAVVRETSDREAEGGRGGEDKSGTEGESGAEVSSGSDRAVQDSSTENTESVYAYDDFLGKSFRLVNACDYYTRDDTYNVWTDQSGDRDFVKKLAENGKKLTITGIVQPKQETMSEALSTGIAYSPLLEEELMKAAAQSEVVKDQLKNP
ncbi:MAG: ABC transporter ATP-binding protein, partial [Bilifractor sp.]|nr:ABC transporter ATP-binding protein [Bilifractor sp.]